VESGRNSIYLVFPHVVGASVNAPVSDGKEKCGVCVSGRDCGS
jgi:hypothetical protein